MSARLPEGIACVSGCLERAIPNPRANASYDLAFTISHANIDFPGIPVEIALDISDSHRAGDIIAVRDPAAPMELKPESPGQVTDMSGFPGKISGQAEETK